MTPEQTEELILVLLEGWAVSKHESDSLFLALQENTEWKSKFRFHFDDQFRRETTEIQFSPLRKAIRAILSGAEPYSSLEQAVLELEKKAN